MGIKLHPRMNIVAGAESELVKFMINLREKYQLTWGEEFKLLSERMGSTAKYLIRSERHPNDPDKKGDEA